MNEYTVLPTSGEWLTYAEAHSIEGEDEEDEETGLEVCSVCNAPVECRCPVEVENGKSDGLLGM